MLVAALLLVTLSASVQLWASKDYSIFDATFIINRSVKASWFNFCYLLSSSVRRVVGHKDSKLLEYIAEGHYFRNVVVGGVLFELKSAWWVDSNAIHCRDVLNAGIHGIPGHCLFIFFAG